MGSKKQPLEDIEWPPGLKQVLELRPGITDVWHDHTSYPIEWPVIPRPLSECFDADADAYR